MYILDLLIYSRSMQTASFQVLITKAPRRPTFPSEPCTDLTCDAIEAELG